MSSIVYILSCAFFLGQIKRKMIIKNIIIQKKNTSKRRVWMRFSKEKFHSKSKGNCSTEISKTNTGGNQRISRKITFSFTRAINFSSISTNSLVHMKFKKYSTINYVHFPQTMRKVYAAIWTGTVLFCQSFLILLFFFNELIAPLAEI